MEARTDAVTALTVLVDRLGACLDYADGEGDHVLAALVSAAHEAAMARLSRAATGG